MSRRQVRVRVGVRVRVRVRVRVGVRLRLRFRVRFRVRVTHALPCRCGGTHRPYWGGGKGAARRH